MKNNKGEVKNISKKEGFPLWYSVLGLVFSILAPFVVFAAWSNPTQNPPSGNVEDPINVANTAQTKQGTLILSSGNAYQTTGFGLIVQNGNVGIASTTPRALLSVDGATGANRISLGDGRIVGLAEVPISNNEAASRYYVDSRTGGASGIPAPGVNGNTMRSDGTNWIANNNLYNNGSFIGIGTTTANGALSVDGNARVSGSISLSGTLEDMMDSRLDVNDDLYVAGGNIQTRSGNDYNKYCMWGAGDTNYCLGMYSAQTFGYLNDYALTFGMSNAVNRGWLWRDVADAASDGAMSLTTDGRLTVKSTSWFQGSVGIASSTPGAPLSVDGGSGATRMLIGDGRIVGITEVPISNNEAASKYYVDFSTGGGLPTPVGYNGYTLRSNGTNWLRNNLIYNNGTNVVVGDATAYGDVRFVVSGTNGNNDSTFLTVKRDGTTNPVFAVLPWDGQAYVSTGVYYSNGVWTHNSNNTNNNMFAMDPGVGMSWYASNNGTASWNVSSNVNLWDDGARWKSSVQSTRAENSYFTGGNLGIGTAAPDSSLSVKSAGNAVTNIYGVSATLDYGAIQVSNIGGLTNPKGRPLVLQPNGGNVGIASSSPVNLISTELGGNQVVFNLGGNSLIRGLGVPSMSTDAASKGYVDGLSGGGIPVPGTNGNTMRSNGTNWVSNNVIYNNGTNVAIGAGVTPGTYKLNVGGTMRWGGTGLATPYTYSGEDGNGLFLEQVGNSAATAKARFQSSPSGSQATYAQFYIDPANGFSFVSNVGGNSGNVGIGVTTPSQLLQVGAETSGPTAKKTIKIGSGGYSEPAAYRTNSNGDKIIFYNADGFDARVGVGTRANLWFKSFGGTNAGNIEFFTGRATAPRVMIDGYGNVGIATTSSSYYKLDVSGNVRFSGELKMGAGDVAENFVPDKEYPAGTVLVLGEGEAKSVTACYSENDKLVVGVVSEKPAVNMGSETAVVNPQNGLAPIALVGVVKVKVNNSNGDIKRGDLLTTSAILGEAMKTDNPVVGSIIGKAMENSSGKHDFILALINLQ